jgi:DNA repair exonuclease SbcCD nuclease subunit
MTMLDPQLLIFGDLHLRDDIPGYLDAQCAFIEKTVKDFNEICPINYPKVVFLGDIFDKRNPSVKVMLALKALISKLHADVFIVRGNHDAVSKADDGVTALSLFESKYAKVCTDKPMSFPLKISLEPEDRGLGILIPHYENEETIKSHLASIDDKRAVVFGHFGYHGSLNSAGDNDFRIPLECFNNLTFLGHIHHYSAKDKVVVVGTPYTTSFQEAGKPNYVIHYKFKNRRNYWKAIPAVGGPKHHVCKLEDLHKIKLDDQHFNLVRVLVNPLKEGNELDLISKIRSDYPLINWVDIRFANVVDTKEEISYYRPERQLFSINEAIIEDYIDSSVTPLSKEDLLSGLKELDEDK